MISDQEERNERLMTLAEKALQTPVHERAGFLQSACRNDPELYQEVSEMVAWEERMGGFLGRPLIEFVDLDALEKVFEPGQVVAGRFEILRRVGDGGMGVVYEAFDRKRKQRIAIKFAKPGFGRLLTPELEGALKVRHPNVCVVNEIHTTETEFGELDFLTMEFLDGETLSRRLARGKPDEAEALQIARQLCAGVAEAHRSGVLHRDLKPGNIILCHNDDGSTRAVITDFGLSTHSAIPGEVEGGTPSYMAPELRREGKPSQASDVFALGVVLYEMVTGRKPFPAAFESNETAPPLVVPSKLVKNLPRRWNNAILPCLRPEPEERCSALRVIDILGHKPFYRRPAALIAVAACFVVAMPLVSILIPVLTPPQRLAVLPIDVPTELEQRSRGILDDVAERVKQLQMGKPTTSVVPLSQALSKGVATPEQAEKILHATHALQLKLVPRNGGVWAEGAIIDLRTMTHVRDYSGYFAEANLDDLRTGLTGLASLGLHLHHASQPESVAPSAAAAYKKGRAYLDQEPQDFKDAMPDFQEAARLDPHSPLPPAGIAEAYAWEYQAQQEEKANQHAQSWLARAEALNPDSITVRMASGLLRTIEGDLAKALGDYQRVEEIEPANAEAWVGSGLDYELQGQQERAIADYTHAIAIAPNYYKPYEYLGALNFLHGKYDKAEDMYKKDIQCAPERTGAYGSLAGVYIAEGKYPEAEQVYKASLGKEKSALTLNDIGAMLAFQGRQKEAMDYYQQAVATDSTMPMYWLNLGDAQRRLKNRASARVSYQRGRNIAQRQVITNPANASARAFLAYSDVRLGFNDQAGQEVAQAMNSPRLDDQMVICAVQTYEALGDRDRAIAMAAKATAQTRNQLDHHPDLARLQHDSRFKSLINRSQ